MRKPYPKYINSNLFWFGEIPNHWQLLANRYIFKLKKSQVGKRSGEYDLLSLTLSGVIKRDLENPQGKFPAEFDTYQEVKNGDFVFCLFDVEETPRTVGLSTFNGMITGAYTVLEAKEGFDKKYLYYFYLTLDEHKRLKPLYRGLRNTIPKDVFFTFKSLIPPLPEQTQIAHFLDHKCALIDTAIQKKTRLIELLKEQKQAIINRAVTRGLNPNTSMKDSGIEWLGEIPAHWGVKKLKYVVRMQSGKNLTSENIGEAGEFPVFGGGGLRGYHNDFTNEGNYVLIGRQGALCGKIIYANGKFWATEHAVVVYPIKKIEILWLGELLTVMNLNQYSQSAAQPGLSVERILNLEIPYPNNSEQVSISNYISQECKTIETTISRIEREIELIKEYKTALIAEAVTGKIDVRDWKPKSKFTNQLENVANL